MPFKLTRQELANLVPQDWSTININWFSNKKEDKIPLPEFRLSFLWQVGLQGQAIVEVWMQSNLPIAYSRELRIGAVVGPLTGH